MKTSIVARLLTAALRRSLLMIVALATPAIAAQPASPQNLTTSACQSTLSRTPVHIFASGVFLGSPPAVDFNFWVWSTGQCDAHNVTVTWVYQTADKTTKSIVKTVPGTTTYQLIHPNVGVTHLTLHCVPTGNTYCRDAAATLQPGNFIGGAVIEGTATATLGPIPPP